MQTETMCEERQKHLRLTERKICSEGETVKKSARICFLATPSDRGVGVACCAAVADVGGTSRGRKDVLSVVQRGLRQRVVKNGWLDHSHHGVATIV